MNEELKPCPSCGKSDQLEILDLTVDDPEIGVLCRMCQWQAFGETRERAIAHWNTRALSSPPTLPSIEARNILGLMWRLDKFCVGQFKRSIEYQIDSALNLQEGYYEEEITEWLAALPFVIKTNLEDYIKEAGSSLPTGSKQGE